MSNILDEKRVGTRVETRLTLQHSSEAPFKQKIKQSFLINIIRTRRKKSKEDEGEKTMLTNMKRTFDAKGLIHRINRLVAFLLLRITNRWFFFRLVLI